MIWSFFLILTELVNFQPTGRSIYSQKFGQLDDDSGDKQVGKIQFIYSGYNDLLFVICTDKSDEIVPIAQVIENIKVAFSQKYFNLIKEGKDDPVLFKSFKAEINAAVSAMTGTKPTAPIESAMEVPPVEKAPTVSTTKKELVKILS